MQKGSIFYRKKMSRETILTIVYLFLTGYPISNMPPLVHVTERSIRNLLEDVITRFKKYQCLGSYILYFMTATIYGEIAHASNRPDR
jgi:hypothetical protein